MLNLKTEKKSFRNFEPIKSGHVSEPKIERNIFDSEKSQDSMGSKFRNDFFPFSNWAPEKNLSNAMSQSFWKQNAAILEHFEVDPFLKKWGGGLFNNQDIVGRKEPMWQSKGWSLTEMSELSRF